MPILAPTDIPRNGPLLGVDPGARRWGIARSDWAQILATPDQVISRGNGKSFGLAANRLLEAFHQHSCIGLIVGLPLLDDGSEGRRAQSARAMVYNLLKVDDVPVCFQDERLSSVEVGWKFESDLAHQRNARAIKSIDAEAAAIILQRFLDSR